MGAIARDQDEKSAAIPGESEVFAKEKIVNDALHSTAFRSQDSNLQFKLQRTQAAAPKSGQARAENVVQGLQY